MTLFKHSVLILTTCSVLLAAFNGQQNAQNASQGGIMGGGGLDKSDIGTGLGAVGGAVIGSSFGKGNGRVVGGVVGGLLGAGIGHEIGASLDRADMTYYNQARQRALETAPANQPLPWNNPQNGHTGVIIPAAPYQNDQGQYCREYQPKITVGGQTQNGYGTACRQPDGAWKIVSQ